MKNADDARTRPLTAPLLDSSAVSERMLDTYSSHGRRQCRKVYLVMNIATLDIRPEESTFGNDDYVTCSKLNWVSAGSVEKTKILDQQS